MPTAERPLSPVFNVRCHYCSRFKGPRDVMPLPGNVMICHPCWQNHERNIRSLGTQQPPRECQACLKSFEALAAESATGEVRMALHYKDGIYQYLCLACDEPYTRKRADLYGDTPFGHRKKLKGSK